MAKVLQELCKITSPNLNGDTNSPYLHCNLMEKEVYLKKLCRIDSDYDKSHYIKNNFIHVNSWFLY